MRPGPATAITAAVVLALAGALTAHAAETKPKEYQIKAQFVRHFTRYVTWPDEAFENAEAPLVIGIFGIDPFRELIDGETVGRTSHDRPLVVRRLTHPQELSQCHLVFLSRSERHRQADLLDALRDRPVLTVGETDWFLRDGGGIRLLTERGGSGGPKPRFEINLTAIEKVGLKASSRMLSLAKTVIQDDKKPDGR